MQHGLSLLLSCEMKCCSAERCCETHGMPWVFPCVLSEELFALRCLNNGVQYAHGVLESLSSPVEIKTSEAEDPTSPKKLMHCFAI